MTIRTTARVAGPFAAGAQSLPFAFKVFAVADICVVRHAPDGAVTHLFNGQDYSVTLHADQERTPGGTVSLTVATPAGFTTLVSTAMPELQLLALTNQGGFQPEVINDALDKQTIMIQQLRARIGPGCGPGGSSGGGGGGGGPTGPIYLSTIEQSGAATGQIPRWNGTAWVASNESSGGGGSTPVGRYAKRIVCVGDSETGQQVLWGEAWPAALERSLRSSGADCEVINLGIGGHTYYRANTDPRHGALTVRQKLIDLKPDIVLVAMGAADAVMLADSRTIAQIKQDATDFYTAVRAALPNCTVVYMSQTPYDVDHATPATLKNKHVLPYQFTKRASGILTNCYCSEILNDDLGPDARAVFDLWKQLDDHIKALPSVSGSAPLNLWRAARVGLLGFDQLHVSAAGSIFLAGYARKAFATVPALATAIGVPLVDHAAPTSQDPDALFTGLVQNTGTEWATKVPDDAILQTLGVFGDYKAADAVAWYMPSKSSLSISNTTYVIGGPHVWTVNGSIPLTQVQTSLDGAAWVNAHFTTDAQGDFLDAGILPVGTPGMYTLRYKIGNEVHGPVTITAVAGGAGGAASAKLRIVVVGDSESAHQSLLARPWPALLAEHLSASRPDIEVINLGINGHTYYKANTVTTYGAKTMRQQAIDLAPAIMLVALGFNDTVMGVDGRTVAQAQADASAFFSAVRSALPSCKVAYLSEVPYDTDHGTPATLVNQQVLPMQMALRSSGILTNCYCSEILTDAASSAARTAYGNWKTLDDSIKSLGTIDGNAPLNLWRAARLGLTGYDGLHMTAAGHYMLAGYARKAFATVPALTAAVGVLPDQAFPLFNDPDNLFTGLVQDVSGAWQAKVPDANLGHMLQQHGMYKSGNAVAWFLPSKSAMSMSNLTYVVGSPFVWTINGSYPVTQVQTSLNGAAWINAHFTTDAQGDFLDAGVLPVTAGTYTMRYKVGNEVHGPVTITAIGSGGGAAAAYGSITGLTGTAVVSTDGSPVQVPLNAAAAVTANGMTASSGRIVVPRAGRYRITFGGMVTGNTGGWASFFIRCQVGTKEYNGSTSKESNLGYAQQSTGSFVASLTAGQDVSLWAYKFGGSVTLQDSGGAAVSNWLTVEEVVS